jgi:uncharacterized protein (DUF1697 family)
MEPPYVIVLLCYLRSQLVDFPRYGFRLTPLLHLYLSRDPIEPGAAMSLEDRAQSGERISLAGGALWIDYGASGVARSKLTPMLIDKACGSPTTGRNWNSVLKIQEMIAARG